ncbi:MAG: preprotein translocase subunit SecG [Candidatus Margulisiibacteriota bacterium]|jgi:preprotein translocase subunit SecG
MKTFLTIIEIIAALGVIITVMLHSPKGEGMGAIGGQARVFSSQKGMETGMDRLTYACAGVFIVTALLIAMIQ